MLILLISFLLLTKCSCEDASSSSDEYEFTETFYQWVNTENFTEFRDIQASLMLKFMNLSVDPCEDFYEYACGNWKNVVPVKGSEQFNVLRILREMQDFVLSRLFWVEVDTEDNETTVKLKQFFESCVDETAWKHNEFIDKLNELSSWPLTSENWTESEFDWLNVTARVHSLNVDVLFKLTAKPRVDGFVTNYFAPLERIPYQDLKYKKRFTNKQSFVELMKARLLMFGVQVGDKEIMLEEVFDLAEELLRTQDNCRNRDPKLSYVKIGDMTVKFPELDFESYFAIYRNQSEISTSERVFINDWECLRDIFEILNQTPPRVIANYILINTLLYYFLVMNYASQGLQNCASFVEQHMLSAAVDLYVDYYFDNDTEHGVKDLIEDIQLAGMKLVTSSEWLGGELKDITRKEFGTFSYQIGYPPGFLNSTRLAAEYKELVIDPKDFIQNLMNLFQTSLRNKQTNIGESIDEMHPFRIAPSFDSGKRIMDVPMGITTPTYFHKYSPGYANYAGLGLLVANEIAGNFDAGQVYGQIKGHNWPNTVEGEKHFASVECFKLQCNEMDNRTTTHLKTIVDTIGLEVASIAYRDWLKKNKDSTSLDDGFKISEETTLTNIQAFFLSYAQKFCSSNAKRKLIKIKTSEDEFVELPRSMMALANSKHFVEAYQCHGGSTFKSIKKCSYFNTST